MVAFLQYSLKHIIVARPPLRCVRVGLPFVSGLPLLSSYVWRSILEAAAIAEALYRLETVCVE
jgi:hypothetical protein